MPKKAGGLQQLLLEELQDLLDAEKQLVKALPGIAKSASDSELEQLFRNHLETTKMQVRRLEEVFESMDMKPRGRPCKGMKGLVEESRELMEEREDPLLDSALVGSARKVEHYEIVAYESVQSLAQQLGMTDAVERLQETLQEEVETERHFAEISRRLLQESSAAGEEGEMEDESMESKGKQSQGRSASGRSRSSSRSSSGGSSRGAARKTGSSPRQASSKSRSTSNSRQASAKGSPGRGKAASGRSPGRQAPAGRSQSSGGGRTKAGAHPLTDHQEIRQWAEERGAHPACVRGTGGGEDIGMIRLDFPGYSGGESLEQISWDEWLEKFDERNLALMVQEKTARGQKSNFNKLVSRHGQQRPKTRSAH